MMLIFQIRGTDSGRPMVFLKGIWRSWMFPDDAGVEMDVVYCVH